MLAEISIVTLFFIGMLQRSWSRSFCLIFRQLLVREELGSDEWLLVGVSMVVGLEGFELHTG